MLSVYADDRAAVLQQPDTETSLMAQGTGAKTNCQKPGVEMSPGLGCLRKGAAFSGMGPSKQQLWAFLP